MLFIHELVSTLMLTPSNEASKGLQILIDALEHRPISARERKLVKKSILDFLAQHRDADLESKIAMRLSYDYLPAMQVLSNKDSGNELDADTMGTAVSSVPVVSNCTNASLQNLKPSSILNTIGKGCQFVCTLHRHRSTLGTSFRLYLNAIQQFESTSSSEHKDSSVFLFGSKIRKGGMMATYPIWTVSDSKEWKEKNTYLKIVRSSNCYSVRLPDQFIKDGIDFLNPVSKVDDEFAKSNITTAKNIAADQSNMMKSVSPVITETAGEGQSQSPQKSSGMIVTLNSRGMDKLIHLTAVMDNSISVSLSTSLSSSSPAWPSSISSAENDHLFHQHLQAHMDLMSDPVKLHNACNNESGEAQVQLLYLKSRLPRKSSARSGGVMHTLEFGKGARVKAPSRKNVVIERVTKESYFNNEWLNVTDAPAPVFQLGKIDEDIFALDFHSISPLQAFVLVMCIFDQ